MTPLSESPLAALVGPSGVVLVLKAFFDESGRDKWSLTFTFCGFIAALETWVAFERDWNEVLQDKPAIRYFKTHDWQTRKGQFKGWTKKARSEKAHRLVDVIKSHRLCGLMSAIPKKQYAVMVAGRVEQAIDNPVFPCLSDALYCCLEYRKERRSREHLALVLDPCQDTDSRVIDAIERCKREDRKIGRILTLVLPPDSKLIPGLQAADMLAWNVRNEWERSKRKGHTPRRIQDFAAIHQRLQSKVTYRRTWKARDLRHWVTMMNGTSSS